MPLPFDTNFDPSIQRAGVSVVVERLDLPISSLRALAGCLSAAEIDRAARCRFVRDRQRFVVARARLRHLLAERLRSIPESLEFACGRNGKPVLAGKHSASDLEFNLSHCGDVAAYAFSNAGPVGIDIEALRAVPDAETIAARFFSRGESVALRALAPEDRPLGFFNCWTRKEAFVKARGDGMSMPLDEFEVSLAPAEPARILRVRKTPGAASGWDMTSFSPANGYVGALVFQRTGRARG